MEDKCQKGKWAFERDESPDFRDRSERQSAKDPYYFSRRFWASDSSGIQVYRDFLNPVAAPRFYYNGPKFCIVFKLSGLINLNDRFALEEAGIDVKEQNFSRRVTVFADPTFTWFDEMNHSQFDQFVADVQDKNLYSCLFDCFPEHWKPPEQRYGPVEKLLFPVTDIFFVGPREDGTFSEKNNDVGGCFEFISKKIEVGQNRSRPKYEVSSR